MRKSRLPSRGCKHPGCERRARSRGWCTTHYRRWRAGKDMDTSIRGYTRYVDDGEGRAVPARPRPRLPKPFAAEWELLRQLGLGDENADKV